MSGYRCATCGEHHDGPTLAFGLGAPDLYDQIPENERPTRAELTSDACVIDGEHCFVLGNIELPISGTDEKFVWSVWVSLSQLNFARATLLWEQPGRESESPYFGWLSSSIPTYPSTINLKTHVHTRPVGVRPLVELEPTDHPLAREQRDGITWERVHQITAAIEHDTPRAG
ncbi:MAG TPA: DUF2199 domain-containing protein [Tepidisphaeraceae bacterium]|nr:DUF2199 domain-containing protein [Tepidisphaeraceae bacterium]